MKAVSLILACAVLLASTISTLGATTAPKSCYVSNPNPAILTLSVVTQYPSGLCASYDVRCSAGNTHCTALEQSAGTCKHVYATMAKQECYDMQDDAVDYTNVDCCTGTLCNTEIGTPADCPVLPSAGGDPHFSGLRGQKFDVTGEPNTWFNIISDTNIQLNALFVHSCFKKETFMGELAFLVDGHKIYADRAHLYLDGVAIPIGVPAGSWIPHTVKLSGENESVVVYHPWINNYEVNAFGYKISLERWNAKNHTQRTDCTDGLFNIKVQLDDYSSHHPHGLLGQTAHSKDEFDVLTKETGNFGHTSAYKPKMGKNGEGVIEGTYHDYIVSSAYASDFKFNVYNAAH